MKKEGVKRRRLIVNKYDLITMWGKLQGAIDRFSKIAQPGEEQEATNSKPRKFTYGRPEFLQLNDDEVQVCQDIYTRPIIVPRDEMLLLRTAGYAEVINGGKSKLNEDQSTSKQFFIKKKSVRNGAASTEIPLEPITDGGPMNEIPVTYFAIFDGHAGPDAAVMASKLLHKLIEEKLNGVKDFIFEIAGPTKGQLGESKHDSKSISIHSLVIGALEQSFISMDQQIIDEKQNYTISGGCAVIVALFLLGKLYIANAGDCRAIYCNKKVTVQLSNDMTPHYERQRIMIQAMTRPELIGEDFTYNEYTRRITRNDIGKRILYRGPMMTGWSYKVADEDDLKVPLIFKLGGKSRLMQTIGVSRGFGDHDLRVFDSRIYLKPLLSAVPEVKVFDLKSNVEDAVLVMASDGLWDVITTEDVRTTVYNVLNQSRKDDPKRFNAVAQELVMQARGTPIHGMNGWTKKDGTAGSFDDITVLVIPLGDGV